MAEFIRPAARAHWFDKEDDMEWGMSEPEADEPVCTYPLDWDIPHPLPNESGLTPATAGEALWFWAQGGWDE